MTGIELNPKDILLLDNGDRTLFFHASSLQIYNIEDVAIADFLRKYKIGEVKNYEQNIIYRQILSVIKKAPKSMRQPDKDNDPPKFNAVILPISGKCNLKCSYCFAKDNDVIHFNDYTEEEAEQNIRALFKDRDVNDSLGITFFGGEPFLNFRILKYIILFIKQNYSNYKVNYSATTNGTVLNEEIIDFIERNNIALLVSIDGPEYENRHRVFKDNRNSFKKVISNIKLLKERDINMSIRNTLANDNINSILKIYDFFERLEIPFSVVFAYKSGNKNYVLADYNQSDLELIKNQFIKLREYYKAKLLKNNKEKIYCTSLVGDLNRIRFRSKQLYNCGAGIGLFSITNDGRVFSCEHFVNYNKYCVGTIHDNIDLEKLSSLKAINVEKIDGCSQCWARYLCAGHCFAQKIQSDKSIFETPDFEECEMKRIYFESVILLYQDIIKINSEYFLKDGKDEMYIC